MNLPGLYYRLPFRFDAAKLAAEIAALPPQSWNRNFRDLKGTASVALISPRGDAVEGEDAPLAATQALAALPYVAQVLAALDLKLGRTRLIRLEPKAGFPPQADSGPYWQSRVQIHIPVRTNPEMAFFCMRQPAKMGAGECWSYNNGAMHRFVNDSGESVIHLVIDVPGDSGFYRLARPAGQVLNEQAVPYSEGAGAALAFEDFKPLALPPVPQFDKPVFVVAAPRSGSTLLFETLAGAQGFWTLGGEGGAQVETIPSLAPQSLGVHSNRLTAAECSAGVVAQLKANYAADLSDHQKRLWRSLGPSAPQAIRFLEKTPKNALRIPFLKAAFPDARFIFLHREAKANIGAIIDAWLSEKFVTYTNLPDWHLPSWSLLLIPGWRELAGKPIGEIAMRLWRDTNRIVLDDLAALDASDWCAVAYEDLVRDPAASVARLCAFAGVAVDEDLARATSEPLKLSRYTLSAPDPEKWRRHERLIAPLLGETEAVTARLTAL